MVLVEGTNIKVQWVEVGLCYSGNEKGTFAFWNSCRALMEERRHIALHEYVHMYHGLLSSSIFTLLLLNS